MNKKVYIADDVWKVLFEPDKYDWKTCKSYEDCKETLAYHNECGLGADMKKDESGNIYVQFPKSECKKFIEAAEIK